MAVIEVDPNEKIGGPIKWIAGIVVGLIGLFFIVFSISIIFDVIAQILSPPEDTDTDKPASPMKMLVALIFTLRLGCASAWMSWRILKGKKETNNQTVMPPWFIAYAAFFLGIGGLAGTILAAFKEKTITLSAIGFSIFMFYCGFHYWSKWKAQPASNEPEELGADCVREAVGTYEGREDDETVVFGLLKNGVYELYENEEIVEEGEWELISDKIHIIINDPEVGTVLNINQINADGSLTEISEMIDGKREDAPKERQYTYKKIK